MNNSETKRAFLTSVPFACGIGWPVNSLVVLGFRTTSFLYRESNWKPVGDGNFRIGDEVFDHLLNHLPVLADRKTFHFEPGFEIFWEHRVNFPLDGRARVLLVIRDPRDAIYSLYRRWKSNGWIQMEFVEYLDRPSDWPDHFPGLFNSNPIMTFLYFNLTWIKSGRFKPVHVLRFEEFKADPKSALGAVVQFLRLPKPAPEKIAEAVASSEGRSSKKKLDEALAAQGSGFKAIFKGQVLEWKDTYSAEWLSRFALPSVRSGLRFLGYEAEASPHDAELGRIMARRSSTLFYKLVFFGLRQLHQRFPDRFEELLNPPEAKRTPKRLRLQIVMKRLLIAYHWGERCASHPREVGELRAFHYQLLRLWLPVEEIERHFETYKERDFFTPAN